MGFSRFHGILDKHICTISNICCEVIYMVLPIDICHLFDTDFFNQQTTILEDGKNIYSLFFAHLKKSILKNLVELFINTTFYLKCPCSNLYEWNLICNKKNCNNCIKINQ